LKSKSTGSKSSKTSTTKTKSTNKVVRFDKKAGPKSDTRKASPSTPKLTAVSGAKSSKSIPQLKSGAIVAAKVSVAEALGNSRLVKTAEVVNLKASKKALSLVTKTKTKVAEMSKVPATKISRSEPSIGGAKVITGRFSVDAVTTTTITAAKVGVDKTVMDQGLSPNAINFKSGDKIVYPGHGVGEIEGIRTTVLGGQEHHIYNITILDSGMKVMVPVSQAMANGLRKIVDKKAIDEVFSILKDRDFKIDTQTWNRRFREYSQKIKTGSVFEIAIVLRDLLVLSADKELSFGEKKMLDMAESLLVSEIAIAKARPHDKVVGELRALFA